MWYCLLCCARWLEFLGTVDEMLVCDHSNASYCTVFSCGTCTRWLNHTLFCGWNPYVWPVKWELSGDLKVEKHHSLYTETAVKNENIACLDFNWHRQRLQKPIKFKEFFLHSKHHTFVLKIKVSASNLKNRPLSPPPWKKDKNFPFFLAIHKEAIFLYFWCHNFDHKLMKISIPVVFTDRNLI